MSVLINSNTKVNVAMDNQIVAFNACIQMWKLNKSIDYCTTDEWKISQAETLTCFP
jgi:hypothetical protein